MRRPTRVYLSAFALIAAGSSCSGIKGIVGGEDNGSGDPSKWAIAIALTPPETSFTLQQAAVDTIGITVTRSGGYTGDVDLFPMNAVGAPGIVTVVEKIGTTGTTTTGRMIITIGPSLPPNVYIIGVGAEPKGSVAGQHVDLNVTIVRKPGIFIQTAPTLSVGRGQTGSTHVTVIRTNFTAPVPMSLATTQPGLTATFSPNPVTDNDSQATISVDASVPEGTYSIGLRGLEGTPNQGTAPVALTVTAPGSIALSFPLDPLLVLKGSSTPTSLNIARTNFTGPVNLVASGLPSGVTALFGNPAPGPSQSITFSASASAAAGTYPITFTGSAAGLQTVSAILNLKVQ